MKELKIFDGFQTMGMIEKMKIVDFLYQHLEQFRDDKDSINNAIEYALGESSRMGGFVIVAYFNEEIAGVVVVNKTGMKGYIPENILVYIAVHSELRGKGLGKTLMEKALELAEGNIALHVEHDNPARFLYEKLGFSNKYLEYRLTR
jgi:ribosomal protein S18 acetylase RimI-like enzyme